MSAIEIMDPKMDTGMVIKEDNHRPFDPSVRLSEQEVIFVMDRLLCCEVRWMHAPRPRHWWIRTPADMPLNILLWLINICHSFGLLLIPTARRRG